MAGLGTLEWVKQPEDPDNPKTPEMLFAVNLKTMKTLPGWFTDAGGEVRNC